MKTTFQLTSTTTAILLAACGALAGLAAGPVHAASLNLTGLAEFAADSNGGGSGQTFWNTLGGDSYFDLYVTGANTGIGGAYLNSGDGAATAINSPLGSGTYQFFIFGEPGADNGEFGLNLYFDGGTSPGISVFAAANLSATGPVPLFAADTSAATRLLDGSTGPGAGTLTYSDGSSNVTLTAYQFSDPTVNNLDRVNAFAATPSGANDFIGSFTLQVRAVPEPKASLLVGCGGLALLGGWLRCRHRRA